MTSSKIALPLSFSPNFAFFGEDFATFTKVDVSRNRNLCYELTVVKLISMSVTVAEK